MFVRQFLLLLLVCAGYVSFSQTDEFCNAMMVITRDAPSRFRNIRGNVISDGPNATSWASGVKVPGTIGARFVASMGLFYEGAFLQTKNKSQLKEQYEKYKVMLHNCLPAYGYKLSQLPNFYPGLEDCKKLVYMREPDENAKSAPAHITLEATYNKDIGNFTLVLYIFEH